MNYIEALRDKGVNVPDCYVTFRSREDFSELYGLIYPKLDSEVYAETTELHFDWDEYMLEEFFFESLPDFIPIAILHDVEVIDDAYFAIRANDPSCKVYHCEIDPESGDVEYEETTPTLAEFMENLIHPEDNYIAFLESKFGASLPQRYKNFIQSYEYIDYNGSKKLDLNEVYYNEFPSFQLAAESLNSDTLEWLPIGSIGEEDFESTDFLVIKVSNDSYPVYISDKNGQRLISGSLTEFLEIP